jgi:hypothetical protein
MVGEHFGIAPVEGLASGCLTLVHNSGGMKEFIPEEFRWDNYQDLKEKISKYMETNSELASWESKRQQSWSQISVLAPQIFQGKVWSQIQNLDTNLLGV